MFTSYLQTINLALETLRLFYSKYTFITHYYENEYRIGGILRIALHYQNDFIGRKMFTIPIQGLENHFDYSDYFREYFIHMGMLPLFPSQRSETLKRDANMKSLRLQREANRILKRTIPIQRQITAISRELINVQLNQSVDANRTHTLNVLDKKISDSRAQYKEMMELVKTLREQATSVHSD